MQVTSPGNWCGGTLVAPTTVLTAAHCIAADETVGVNNEPAELVELDRERDLAVLELDAPLPGLEPYEVAEGLPSAGTPLRLVGNGCTGDLEVRELESMGGRWARGCACHGDSGGPVLLPSGRVVGIWQGVLQDHADEVVFVDITGER